MSFRLRWTPEASATFEALQHAAEQAQESRSATKGKGGSKSPKQEGLFKHVAKAVRLHAENPRHPSLNTHEVDSMPHPFDDDAKVVEAYAQNHTPGAYRIFWCYGPNQGDITIIAITPHP